MVLLTGILREVAQRSSLRLSASGAERMAYGLRREMWFS